MLQQAEPKVRVVLQCELVNELNVCLGDCVWSVGEPVNMAKFDTVMPVSIIRVRITKLRQAGELSTVRGESRLYSTAAGMLTRGSVCDYI